jgi:SAM-dependent methyltransferase
MSRMKSLLRIFIESQQWLSRKLDLLLPRQYCIDGNSHYITHIVPKYLTSNLLIYDVGGGKRPFLSVELKRQWNARVIGLDISENELRAAPEGAYDAVIHADIASYCGKQDGDLILCGALLEHVHNVEEAFKGMRSLLKNDGKAVIFVPSSNAVYAKINLLLPEKIKKTILYTLFPQTQKAQGFKAYYDRCTPRDFKKLAFQYGFEVEELQCYFISSYFSFFFPLYLAWRLWILLFRACAGEQAAETFSIALKKKPGLPALPASFDN